MADPAPRVRIASPHLSLEVSTLGAEMQDLRDAAGRSLQWDGDPAVWNGRAPILFPIVGALVDGRYRHGGRSHELPRHGFARRSTFDIVSHDTASVAMRLVASDATRAVYPFEFRLDVAYALVDDALRIAATIANDGDAPMPASLGFHPAFRWPLPYGRPRDAHAIVFERDEPAPMRRLDADGLVAPEPIPSPIVGRTLALRDALFADDALVFDRVASRRVAYGAPDGPRLEIAFDDFPILGIWTKPHDAGFVCIEPWQGLADPAGFDGDIRDKPGIVVLDPGAARTFAMTIASRGASG